MSLRICMCCGEPMAELGDAHSRNPNMCASCSSLSDGMPESSVSSFPDCDDKTLVELDFPQVTPKAMWWAHMRKMTTMSRSTTQVSQTNSWIALTNFTLTEPVQEWIDTSVNAVVAPQRFYRVVPIP